MATVIPPFDKFAGLRIGAQNLAQGFATGLQRQDLKSQQQRGFQQLAQLFPNLNLQNTQGITDPRLLGIAAQLGIAQQSQQASLAQTIAGQRPTVVPQGATAIGPEGEPLFVSPRPKAGPLQIAKAGSGLPEGTVFQSDKEGNIKIISPPNVLTFDEQRKRELIAGGLQPKEVTELEKNLTRSVIAKNRAESEERLRSAKGILTPEQKISQTNTFRKEFDALSKDFRTMRDSFVKMNAAAEDPSGAGDIALIFNFMKILDPNSVVRESEFATAENAASVPVAVRNLWNKALTGERIKFNRADFIRTAQNLMKGQRGTQNTLINRYTKLSNRFGLNSQDVVTEIEEADRGTILSEPVSELSEIDRRIAELEAKR